MADYILCLMVDYIITDYKLFSTIDGDYNKLIVD